MGNKEVGFYQQPLEILTSKDLSFSTLLIFYYATFRFALDAKNLALPALTFLYITLGLTQYG